MTENKIDKDILSKVMDWSTLVTYQSNTIISRTLIDFDTGQGLSEHTAPYDAFVLILDGEMEITIKETSHTMKKGGCIIMPADKPHALQAKDRTTMLLIMIKA